ncbi:hypothetical protein [Parabacteroides sp. FAFU027]|uniref:hypothetical protein n=1 Tax=Parabacteroides sp. FAFU027 TaxID=2922715 RepID=UPI001FAF0960|nr:hypothetical protein [Parabacteroides sp. FAFU027]
MKKSNIVLALLAIVFIAAYSGNFYYQKSVYEPWRMAFEKSIRFKKVKDSIRVVCVVNAQENIHQKIEFEKGDWIYDFILIDKFDRGTHTYETLTAFGKMHTIKGDTLLIPGEVFKSLSSDSAGVFHLRLPNLQEVYYNGKSMSVNDKSE